MSRYQCPRCNRIHRTENTPRCPIHGMNTARGCDGCATAAALVPCRRNPR